MVSWAPATVFEPKETQIDAVEAVAEPRAPSDSRIQTRARRHVPIHPPMRFRDSKEIEKAKKHLQLDPNIKKTKS